MPKLSYLKALNRALGDEMECDPAVFVLGEDVRAGLTGTTAGLEDRFGPRRVLETPIS
jgi:pyruvate/2-oxoglutarate/acetoin dehydrogenase E1 component